LESPKNELLEPFPMKIAFRVGLLLLAATFFAVCAPVFGKGSFDKVVIAGPGIDSVDVTEAARVGALGLVTLMNVPVAIEPPVDLSAGYELTRYFVDGSDYQVFDQAIYYPDILGTGYVYYVGIVNGSSEYDGNWYRATVEGDAAMRAILSENGIAVEWNTAPLVFGNLRWAGLGF
jgi:hypothetical protein